MASAVNSRVFERFWASAARRAICSFNYLRDISISNNGGNGMNAVGGAGGTKFAQRTKR